MAIKDIYQQVLAEIRGHPELKGTRKGLLYKIIQILNEEENSQTQEKTEAICREFGIKSNSRIQEDKEIFIELIDLFYNDELLPTFLKYEPILNGFQDFKKNLIQFCINEENPMERIILAAVSIVGVFGSAQFLKNKQRKLKPKKQVLPQQKPEVKQPPLPPIVAFLSIVVSASSVKDLNLEEGKDINIDTLNELIDRTYYFKTDADRNEENLEITDEPIISDSPREVYLRINVEDGKGLLDKPVNLRYTLKRNLPRQGKFKIERIACLGSLSGLDKFVRA